MGQWWPWMPGQRPSFADSNTAYTLNSGFCQHCGMMHGSVCPRIKAIEYNQDGTVKRIEYHGACQS